MQTLPDPAIVMATVAQPPAAAATAAAANAASVPVAAPASLPVPVASTNFWHLHSNLLLQCYYPGCMLRMVMPNQSLVVQVDAQPPWSAIRIPFAVYHSACYYTGQAAQMRVRDTFLPPHIYRFMSPEHQQQIRALLETKGEQVDRFLAKAPRSECTGAADPELHTASYSVHGLDVLPAHMDRHVVPWIPPAAWDDAYTVMLVTNPTWPHFGAKAAAALTARYSGVKAFPHHPGIRCWFAVSDWDANCLLVVIRRRNVYHHLVNREEQTFDRIFALQQEDAEGTEVCKQVSALLISGASLMGAESGLHISTRPWIHKVQLYQNHGVAKDRYVLAVNIQYHHFQLEAKAPAAAVTFVNDTPYLLRLPADFGRPGDNRRILFDFPPNALVPPYMHMFHGRVVG